MTRRGGVREVAGKFYAYARYGKGKQLELRVRTAKTEAEALARAHMIAEAVEAFVRVGRRDLIHRWARELADTDDPKKIQKAIARILKDPTTVSITSDVTFGEWARRFTSGELTKSYGADLVPPKDWSDDASRLRRYILPHVEDVPIGAFELRHAQLVMARLPKMEPTNRRHVGQIMGRLLRLAVMPGQLIKATPLPPGWLPKTKVRHHYSCLFPREESLLLGHVEADEAFRLFCGVLNREGMRLSELLDAEWSQWGDDCRTFMVTRTKTNDPRMWAVRVDVAMAMRLWRARAGGRGKPFAAVISFGDRTKLAERFRAALKAAGVKRPELFDSTEHTKRIRAHDMRATFVTISLAAGKSETWIRDRTAHKSTSMIDRYRRQARQLAELEVGELDHLVDALGWDREQAPGSTSKPTDGSGSDGGAGKVLEETVVFEGPEEAQVLESTEGGTRTLTPKGRRILKTLRGSETSPDAEETRWIETSCDVLGGTPSSLPAPQSRPDATASADSAGETVQGSTRPAGGGRARVEVDGAVVAEADGTPRQIARRLARGLRRAGQPAIATGAKLVVGGRR